MLYGIIAAFDMRISNETVSVTLGNHFQPPLHANSGKTVEYALTSRTLHFQPMI